MAEDGEQLLALDGKTYTLDCGMSVIADDKARARHCRHHGRRGHRLHREHDQRLHRIGLVRSGAIAATGRKLGILSDARYRFERGVDPDFVRAGRGTRDETDPGILRRRAVRSSSSPARRRHGSRRIDFAPDAVERLAGLDLPMPEITRILDQSRLHASSAGRPLTVTPPSWRSDIDGAADLVEEVVRIHGLDHVPSVPHAAARGHCPAGADRRAEALRTVRRALAARGFNETRDLFLHFRGSRPTLFGGGDEARQLDNPIAADLDAMRPSLLPSLLAAAGRNRRAAFRSAACSRSARLSTAACPATEDRRRRLRIGRGARDWAKSSHGADAFDAKADSLPRWRRRWAGR